MIDLDGEVSRLWQDGRTSTEIAEALQITRSAVMGRVNRLRKKGHLVDFRNGPFMKTIRKPRAPKAVGGAKMPFVMPTYPGRPIRRRKGFVVNQTPEIVVKKQQYKTILELMPDDCRYIVGTVKTRGTLYCAEPKEMGSYCKSHGLICYHVAKPAGERKPRRKVTGLLLKR